MRYVPLAIILALATPAFADDPKPATKVEAKKVEPKKDAPASQPAKKEEVKKEEVPLPDGAPKDAAEAVEMAQQGIEFAKAKNWWGMSAIAIFILMFILKVAGVFKKVGKRWAYILVPVLSLAAMLLTKFAGGLSWGAAIAVLTSGPAMAALSDLVKRGVLGKEHKTPVNGGAK